MQLIAQEADKGEDPGTRRRALVGGAVDRGEQGAIALGPTKGFLLFSLMGFSLGVLLGSSPDG